MSLLTLRKTIKAKKPIYKRQDEHKKARLRTSWRKPKGRDSKMRLGHKGHKKRVGIGYGSPRQVKQQVKHLHGAGLKPVVVHNLQEMLSLNKEKEIAVIAHSVGLRKALAIAKKAKEKMVEFLNLDVDGFIKYADELMKKKKEMPPKEAKKEKAAGEAAEGKEELAEKVAKEEKKQEKEEKDKEEKDKLLIRREL